MVPMPLSERMTVRRKLPRRWSLMMSVLIERCCGWPERLQRITRTGLVGETFFGLRIVMRTFWSSRLMVRYSPELMVALLWWRSMSLRYQLRSESGSVSSSAALGGAVGS